MRKIRLRKGLGAFLFIGLLVALVCLQRSGVDERKPFHINTSILEPRFELATSSRNMVVGGEVRRSHPLANPTCRRVNNVAFIKTHKAGSSTIANILQRFGMEHDLNFALPQKKIHTPGYNYIVRPGEVFTASKLIPLPRGQRYNILWNHSVYNKTAFRRVLANDTVYVTILREPFQQFVSSVEYYGVIKTIAKSMPQILNQTNPISFFLKSPWLKRAFSRNKHYGYVQNKQGQDLGFGYEEFMYEQKRQAYIEEMDKDFTFVMIMEHFDESLLILKRKLCWNMTDILYIPKNRNRRKPRRTFTAADHHHHRLYSPVDYSLYEHFLNVYNNIIKQQSPDFFQELTHYKNLLSQVRGNCQRGRGFSILQSPWHEAFEVTKGDCNLMMMSELEGLTKLLARMHQSPGAGSFREQE